MIKLKDLIENRIYRITSDQNTTWIYKHNHCYIVNEGYYKITFNHNLSKYKYFEATLEESIHLEECIKADKYIPFKEIKLNKELEIEIW